MKTDGTVYLVGAGPGDPGLLTLRGAELLARADVVVHDALVNDALLRLARRDAEIVYAGKRSRDHAIPQEELNRLLVARAREGKKVVRLKGGDPFLFGRGGEEAEELVAAGIPFEVVPGVTSVVAAPAYAGIPVTHRKFCSALQVITGHEDPSKESTAVDWAAVARLAGTKVILMGVERMRDIADQLIRQGMPATTPCAMVRWGTTGRQQTVEGTLGTIADLADAHQMTAPAVAVIGDVVSLRKRLNWFEKRPLFGKRIVVTRTRQQASETAHEFRERGAEVLEVPTIRVEPPKALEPLIESIGGLGEYDWMVFTSPNGVTCFFDYFFKAYDDIRAVGNMRFAAIGPATAARLQEYHLKVDAMPGEYLVSKVAAAIASVESIENLRFLLLRAEVANPELPRRLEELGGIVDDVACYRTVPETEDRDGQAARLAEEGADWITFASASTVENFHSRFDLPALVKKFPRIQLASIGPETNKALERLSLEPTVTARPHTIAAMVKAVEQAVVRSQRDAR